jgi:hypothetical protein
MKQKINLINEIKNINPNKVWEIDKSQYYMLIGWDGGKDSYWLNYNLEKKNNIFLKKLLEELNKN